MCVGTQGNQFEVAASLGLFFGSFIFGKLGKLKDRGMIYLENGNVNQTLRSLSLYNISIYQLLVTGIETVFLYYPSRL